MLCTKLVGEGYKVTAVDILKYEKNSLSHLFSKKNFTFLKLDITKKKNLKKIILNQDFIILVDILQLTVIGWLMQEAQQLCGRLSVLVEHMQRQAELEVKFPFGRELPEGTAELKRGNYQLYYNEVLHTDNTVLASSGDFKMAYLTNNGHNSLMTTNPVFHDHADRAVKNLLSKSSLVSGTSEKERNRIFMAYQDKIDQMRSAIK